MYPSELGSNERSLNVSKITLFLELSSPLLTSNEKVPCEEFILATSHLRLSAEPDFREPSEFSSRLPE